MIHLLNTLFAVSYTHLIGDGETAVGGVQLFQMLLSQIDQDGDCLLYTSRCV